MGPGGEGSGGGGSQARVLGPPLPPSPSPLPPSTPGAVCVARLRLRKGHPTFPHSPAMEAILANTVRMIEPPVPEEVPAMSGVGVGGG